MMQAIKQTDIYCYFVIFLLIYLEWGYDPVVAHNISGVLKTGLMILGVMPLLFLKNFHLDKRSSLLFIYLTVAVLLSAIRDADLENSILLFVPIFCAFVITSSFTPEKSLNAFCNIITVLAAFSLIVYIISLIAPSFISLFPRLPNRYSNPVYNLGLAVMPMEVTVVRNFGMTWEPGAFALLLCLAIFGQIVGYKTLSKPKIVINVLALITTLSTMGIVVLVIIILITRFRTSAVSNSRSALLLLFLFVVAIIFLMSSSTTQFYEAVFGKLSGLSVEGENVETTQSRINAVIYPGAAFLSSPLIGVGYDAFRYINDNLCDNVATNTIVNWFAIGGIILGLPCTYFYLKLILKAASYLDLNTIFKIALIAACVLLISTESLLRISLIYVLIFYGCTVQRIVKHD